MTWAMGRKGRLALDFETTFGQTPAVPAAFSMPINKSALAGKQKLIDAATITGRRDPVAPVQGNTDVSGNIVVPLDARAMGYWFKAMFGTPTTTGSGPYVHVFKVGETMPSLTLEQGFSDVGQYFLYNGCKISKAGFSFGGDTELTASLDIMGAKETLSATAFDTTLTDIVFERFSNFQASLTEGGAAIATCTEAKLDIDFGLNGDTYCVGGEGYRSAIAEGMLGVSGKVKAMFQNATLLNKAISGAKSSLKVTLTNGTNILELSVPELVYERNTPPIDGPKGVFVELSFKGYYQNSADASVVKVSLTNGVTSYA